MITRAPLKILKAVAEPCDVDAADDGVRSSQISKGCRHLQRLALAEIRPPSGRGAFVYRTTCRSFSKIFTVFLDHLRRAATVVFAWSIRQAKPASALPVAVGAAHLWKSAGNREKSCIGGELAARKLVSSRSAIAQSRIVNPGAVAQYRALETTMNSIMAHLNFAGRV
ncbi:MAG: hypothetical protein AAGO57_08165 [Pseudomonadota bacterium]